MDPNATNIYPQSLFSHWREEANFKCDKAKFKLSSEIVRGKLSPRVACQSDCAITSGNKFLCFREFVLDQAIKFKVGNAKS